MPNTAIAILLGTVLGILALFAVALAAVVIKKTIDYWREKRRSKK